MSFSDISKICFFSSKFTWAICINFSILIVCIGLDKVNNIFLSDLFEISTKAKPFMEVKSVSEILEGLLENYNIIDDRPNFLMQSECRLQGRFDKTFLHRGLVMNGNYNIRDKLWIYHYPRSIHKRLSLQFLGLGKFLWSITNLKFLGIF